MNDIMLRAAESEAPEALRYCEFGSTYLKFSEETPYEAWAFVLSRLQGAQKSLRWWIGDALRFGERKYGEMYSQALEATPYAYSTLRQSVWVADKVPLSLRKDNLGFSHHEQVASLQPEEQEVILTRAEQEGWTVKDTNEAAREVRMIPAAVRKERAAKNEEVSEELDEEETTSMMICPYCQGDGIVPTNKARRSS